MLRRLVLEYAKVVHEPQTLRFSSWEFYHRYEAKQVIDELKKDPSKISSAILTIPSSSDSISRTT